MILIRALRSLPAIICTCLAFYMVDHDIPYYGWVLFVGFMFFRNESDD